MHMLVKMASGLILSGLFSFEHASGGKNILSLYHIKGYGSVG